MGYTNLDRRRCKDSDIITTISGRKEIVDVVKECKKRIECKGFYTTHCKGGNFEKVLCRGEPVQDTTENKKSCFWVKGKF